MKHLKSFILFEAKLPDSHLQKNAIKNMKNGDTGYTVPWAIKVNLDGDCFINGDFTIGEEGGTCCLKVKKVSDGIIAYILDLPNDYKDYEKEEIDHLSNLIEVIGFDDDIDSYESEDLESQLKDALDKEDYKLAAIIRDKIKSKK